MIELSNILQIVLPIVYAMVLGCFAAVFFRRPSFRKYITPLVVVAIVLHTAYIGIFTVAAGHCLLTTIYELFSLIAFTLLVTYSLVELRRSVFAAGTGMMVIGVCFLFQLFSSLDAHPEHLNDAQKIFADPTFNVHVTTAVFGYSALTLATIYGSLYLLLYRAMRQNSFGSVFHEIPSLDRLEKFGVASSGVGFVFLTASIIFGAILAYQDPLSQSSSSYIFDPKTITTVLIWIVFGLTLLIRKITRLEGRKIVLFWMSGFGLTILSMTIINHFVSDVHSFL